MAHVAWSRSAPRSVRGGMLLRRSAVAVAAGLVITGCGDVSGSGTTVTATVLVQVTVTASAGASAVASSASHTPTNSQAPTADSAGTRTDPIPAGKAAKVGDWTIKMGSTVTNAANSVAAANQFNKPAPHGKQFVMVKVAATYNGAGSKMAATDLRIVFVGSGGNTFGSSLDDYCGVIPEPLINTGEVYTAATATGNVCTLVTADQIPGGAWSVKAGFDSEGTFFAQA